MPEPSDTDWAYAAGFVDGEGCIAIVRSFVEARSRFYYSVHLVVANRERSVLEWMQASWGGWVVAVSTRVGRARESWTWRSRTGLGAEPFLLGIRPWLRLKGPQCDNALAMIAVLRRGRRTLGPVPLPAAWLEEQEKLYWIQRELNHRGSDPFVAKPMHSPRKISRARALQAAQDPSPD
jgi:hypothetical protein